eukprot:365426-Chlamydomonas_euryale.AAC.5
MQRRDTAPLLVYLQVGAEPKMVVDTRLGTGNGTSVRRASEEIAHLKVRERAQSTRNCANKTRCNAVSAVACTVLPCVPIQFQIGFKQALTVLTWPLHA